MDGGEEGGKRTENAVALPQHDLSTALNNHTRLVN